MDGSLLEALHKQPAADSMKMNNSKDRADALAEVDCSDGRLNSALSVRTAPRCSLRSLTSCSIVTTHGSTLSGSRSIPIAPHRENNPRDHELAKFSPCRWWLGSRSSAGG